MANVDRRWLHDGAALIARYLPGYVVERVAVIGEGLDNIAFEVNGELIVRRSKVEDTDERAESIRREAGLLALVARHVSLPMPEVVFTDPESGTLVYRKLPGVPLSHLVPDSTEPVARALGRFLSDLHRVPIPEVEALVERDTYPLGGWLEDATRDYREFAESLNREQRRAVEAFFTMPLPPEPTHLVLCHNDLGAEHLLVDAESAAITGVIDWTDAAIADPAVDFALILRDLGPDAFDHALAEYDGRFEESDRARATFYARCKLIEDIAYGRSTGELRYADNALAHFDWVFHPGNRGG